MTDQELEDIKHRLGKARPYGVRLECGCHVNPRSGAILSECRGHQTGDWSGYQSLSHKLLAEVERLRKPAGSEADVPLTVPAGPADPGRRSDR